METDYVDSLYTQSLTCMYTYMFVSGISYMKISLFLKLYFSVTNGTFPMSFLQAYLTL